jgi:hypothetical protein
MAKRMPTASHATPRPETSTPRANVSSATPHAASADGRRTTASDGPRSRDAPAASQ